MLDTPPLTPPRLEALIENVPGNVYRRVRRPDGSYYFAFLSSGLFRYFGIDNERLLAEPSLRFDWIHPDDKERFQCDLALSAATLSLLDHRIRVVGQDGRVHWARGIARPERWPDGSVVWDGIVIDVTREVEAEAALRITRDDAERSHQRTTGIVTDVAERLGRPIDELQSLLDVQDAQSPVGEAIRHSLAACLDA
jgi:PAS fold